MNIIFRCIIRFLGLIWLTVPVITVASTVAGIFAYTLRTDHGQYCDVLPRVRGGRERWCHLVSYAAEVIIAMIFVIGAYFITSGIPDSAGLSLIAGLIGLLVALPFQRLFLFMADIGAGWSKYDFYGKTARRFTKTENVLRPWD